jgi:hypothetical protein
LRNFNSSALTSRGRQLRWVRIRGSAAVEVVVLMLLPPVGM